MAVVKTKKIFIYGLNTDRKSILEKLHQMEAVEVSDFPAAGERIKRQETAQSISQFDRFIHSAQEAIDILGKYAPEKTGMFYSRTLLPLEKYSMSSGGGEAVQKSVYEIIRLSDKIHENAENARRIDAKQLALRPYLPLDVPMKTTETKYAEMQAGLLAGQWTQSDLSAALGERGLSDVCFEILEGSKAQTSVWFAYLKSRKKDVGAFFQSIGLQEPVFSFSHRDPADKTRVLQEAKRSLAEDSEACAEKIKGYAKDRREIELWYDHLVMRREKYDTLSKIGVTDNTFILEGYVLVPHADALKERLEDEFSAYVELSDPGPEENAPIALQNSGFARPVEGITEMYSMPGRFDVDPNPVMSFFYYFFFGMMFSDAGYGLMLMIACGLLGYGKFLEPSKRQMFRMFFFCGVSTTFWGIMYGSFFGDAISAFSGGRYTFAPLWMDPVAEPLQLLIFAVAVGLVHVVIALFLKFYETAKAGDVKGAIFDTGAWIAILIGIGVLAVGAALGNGAALNVGIGVAVAGLVLLVATHGRQNKNPIMKLMGGVLGIYDITGYVGDILSYSRLMALGLTTGVIASVINLLGPVFGELVFGDSPAAYIIIVLVFIAGHLVNFAINMLGAYVHTNRLQYVEFFSKFYDGGGRKFTPFKMNTKYHRFTEK